MWRLNLLPIIWTWGYSFTSDAPIDQSHKYWNTSAIYPTIHPISTEICTFQFQVLHSGIWDRCIMGIVRWVYWITVLGYFVKGTRVLSWSDQLTLFLSCISNKTWLDNISLNVFKTSVCSTSKFILIKLFPNLCCAKISHCSLTQMWQKVMFQPQMV